MKCVDQIARGEPPGNPGQDDQGDGAIMADLENTLFLDLANHKGELKGRITIELRPDLAPNYVARIKELAREGFYDNVVFHRVIEGFMAQGAIPPAPVRAAPRNPTSSRNFPRDSRARHLFDGPLAESRFGQQPIFYLLR